MEQFQQMLNLGEDQAPLLTNMQDSSGESPRASPLNL